MVEVVEQSKMWLWEPTNQLRWRKLDDRLVLQQLFLGQRTSLTQVDLRQEWREVPVVDGD